MLVSGRDHFSSGSKCLRSVTGSEGREIHGLNAYLVPQNGVLVDRTRVRPRRSIDRADRRLWFFPRVNLILCNATTPGGRSSLASCRFSAELRPPGELWTLGERPPDDGTRASCGTNRRSRPPVVRASVEVVDRRRDEVAWLEVVEARDVDRDVGAVVPLGRVGHRRLIAHRSCQPHVRRAGRGYENSPLGRGRRGRRPTRAVIGGAATSWSAWCFVASTTGTMRADRRGGRSSSTELVHVRVW